MPKEQMTSKPEKDATSSAIENNPCGQCRKMGVPICRGHGASGGGGGGGEGKGEELKIVSASDIKPSDIFFKFTQGDDGAIKVVDNLGNDLKSKELESKLLLYNFQTLFKQQLEINSNPKDLTLTIKIRADLPQDQKEVLQEFLTLLKQKCDSVVLADPKNKFLADGYKAEIDEKKGKLKVYIPYQKIYHDVIKDLSKNAPVLFEQAKQQREEKQRSAAPLQEEKASVGVGKTPKPFQTSLTRNRSS